MRKKSLYKDKLSQLTDNLNIFKDLDEISKVKGSWQELFNNENPIVLEVGIGNGGFLNQLIKYHEENEKSYNYIGIEIKEERVYKAFQKNKDWVTNGVLKLIIGKAETLTQIFGDDEVSQIYINFADPWPRDKQAKNRLTNKKFLDAYKDLLVPQGDLFVKTDSGILYDYTLETLKESDWNILEISEDLHTEDFLIKNFVTEFENKWLKGGKNIYFIHAQSSTK